MKDFIALSDYTPENIAHILSRAASLKREYLSTGNKPLFKGKVLGMIFQKPSLRTRVSFDMAMRHCEGDALYFSPVEIGMGKREPVRDIARVLSGYVDAIMARTFSHEDIRTLAHYATIPVINGLSEHNHPCQAMADALTIKEFFGFETKGLTIVFMGDMGNTSLSLMMICAQLGWHFILAGPHPEAHLSPLVREKAEHFCTTTNGSITFTCDPYHAVKNADIIYTDSWISMDNPDALIDVATYLPYQVNSELMRHAPQHTRIMHCLPAHRTSEITDDALESPQSVVFQQAHNRLHAQKAILAHLFKV